MDRRALDCGRRRYEKAKLAEKLAAPATARVDESTKYGRSGKFFEQLQADVRKAVRGDDDAAPPPKKRKGGKGVAAKLM